MIPRSRPCPGPRRPGAGATVLPNCARFARPFLPFSYRATPPCDGCPPNPRRLAQTSNDSAAPQDADEQRRGDQRLVEDQGRRRRRAAPGGARGRAEEAYRTRPQPATPVKTAVPWPAGTVSALTRRPQSAAEVEVEGTPRTSRSGGAAYRNRPNRPNRTRLRSAPHSRSVTPSPSQSSVRGAADQPTSRGLPAAVNSSRGSWNSGRDRVPRLG